MTLQKLHLQKSDKFFINKNGVRSSKNFRAGFSLVEISIFLLFFAVGFTMLFSLINSYITTLKSSRERIAANFLAQEGLELILSKRNENFITLNDTDLSNNKDWLNGLTLDQDFCINPDLTISFCDGIIYLGANSNFYNHNSLGKQTIFTRKIKIQKVPNTDNAVEVASRVNWDNSQIKLNMIMTKWHPKAN